MGPKPTIRKLQKECRGKHLSAKGSKHILEKRLQEHVEANKEKKPPGIDVCGARLATHAEIGEEQEVITSAMGAFRQALQNDDLTVEEAGGEWVVGNRRGLNLAGLPARIALLQAQDASQDQKIASLQARNASLTSSLPSYKTLRNRFISTFKRDVLNNATEADKRIIARIRRFREASFPCWPQRALVGASQGCV